MELIPVSFICQLPDILTMGHTYLTEGWSFWLLHIAPYALDSKDGLKGTTYDLCMYQPYMLYLIRLNRQQMTTMNFTHHLNELSNSVMT